MWQLEQQLSPEEKAERERLITKSHLRLRAIMVESPYPHISKPRTPQWLGKELGRRDFADNKLRDFKGTEWMHIDTDVSGAAIELQVRSYEWREDARYQLYPERRCPNLAFWVRLHDTNSKTASSPVEIFDFPYLRGGEAVNSSGFADVRVQGVSLPPDSPHWGKLDEILDDLEAHMGLAKTYAPTITG